MNFLYKLLYYVWLLGSTISNEFGHWKITKWAKYRDRMFRLISFTQLYTFTNADGWTCEVDFIYNIFLGNAYFTLSYTTPAGKGLRLEGVIEITPYPSYFLVVYQNFGVMPKLSEEQLESVIEPMVLDAFSRSTVFVKHVKPRLKYSQLRVIEKPWDS